MDTLERDIKQLLTTSPEMRLQWRVIRNGVYENYKKKYKTPSSFSVMLHRSLKRLCRLGDIEKEEVGHQEVFYFIPKKRQGRIEDELRREYARKAFDEFWDMLTPEQRKSGVEDLLRALQSLVPYIQKSAANFVGIMKELTQIYISQLENPEEHIQRKYSPDQRREFLEELYDLREEWEKMKIDKPRIMERGISEEIRVMTSLIQEFMKEVVEPNYSGKWNAAIIDLMRKAVAEQRKKKTEN